MYSSMIEEYINTRKGVIFDAGYEHQNLFPVIPYKTFLKIIERLVNSGKMTRIFKGIYAILDVFGNHEIIEIYYTKNYSGIVVGDEMYNNLGISDENPKYVTIYTKKINTKTKNFGNFRLINVDLFFSEHLVKIVQLLECIENYNSIVNMNLLSYSSLVAEVIKIYEDTIFRQVIKTIEYKYSTILSFHETINPFLAYGNPKAVYDKTKL